MDNICIFDSWFSFFDIGLGNGLKNTLANKLATNDIPGAKKQLVLLISLYLFWP